MCTGGLSPEEVSQALRYEEPFLTLIASGERVECDGLHVSYRRGHTPRVIFIIKAELA